MSAPNKDTRKQLTVGEYFEDYEDMGSFTYKTILQPDSKAVCGTEKLLTVEHILCVCCHL